MDFVKTIPQLPEKEKRALDRKLEVLKSKLYKAKQQYDALAYEYKELWDKRHPEKQQEYVKETLYQAYLHSQRSLEDVLIYMAMPDAEDQYQYADHSEDWDI